MELTRKLFEALVELEQAYSSGESIVDHEGTIEIVREAIADYEQSLQDSSQFGMGA